MIRKEILTGIIIGITANLLGFIGCGYLFSWLSNRITSFENIVQSSLQNGSIGSLIALGAIPNLILFFFFLRQNKFYRSRGILIVCIIAALCVAISKF